MPTQNAASEVVRELQVAPGSLQLALTLLKELPVSAYPDQLVEVTSLRPLKPGDVTPTRWLVGGYPTVSFLISEIAIAFASSAAEWVAAGAAIGGGFCMGDLSGSVAPFGGHSFPRFLLAADSHSIH